MRNYLAETQSKESAKEQSMLAYSTSLDGDIRDAIDRLIEDLGDQGHRYQLQASHLLRNGRTGWEAWFDAGVELKQGARRLRNVRRLLERLSRTAPARVAVEPAEVATSSRPQPI